jgi:hypothetical protein
VWVDGTVRWWRKQGGCHAKWNKLPDIAVVLDWTMPFGPNWIFLLPVEIAYKN